MTEHSRLFAPSAAHRWMNCTGSSVAASRYRDLPGEAAMEGTAAHWLVERSLVDGTDPSIYKGCTLTVSQDMTTREFVVDEDMIVDTRIGVDAFRRIALQPGLSRVEAVARLPGVDPELFGRTDVWHFGDDGWLTIGDYKHGRVDVDVARNPQEMTYALGIYREHVEPKFFNKVNGVRLVIAQPRSLTPGPRVKHWTCSLDDLLSFEDELRAAVRMVRENPTFRMGHWCKYCSALGSCPETQEQRRIISHVLAMTDIGPQQAAKVLFIKDLLEKKIKDAEAVLRDALVRGEKVEPFGLFTSVKHRRWRDEEQAKDALAEACGIGVLSAPTPAQAEKHGAEAKAVVDALSFTPPGEPAVGVVGRDKRAPYVVKSIEQMFGGA